MSFEVWPEAIELGRLFADEGYELALVGGPVRDMLLHRRSHDLDFCTSARPEQFEPILRRWGRDGFWDMGRKFGTLGAMRRRADGTEVQVEVTTYRSDVYDPDSRKPEVSYGDTLEGDLSRRDFTVNAMALRVPDLEFVDPFGGANDLAKGVLRTPVDPRQSFDDDPLRMMRAVRFVAQLGFRIEPETAEAITDMVDRIGIVSAERVRDELVKMLLSDRPRAGIEALVESGLADIVFPEVPALQLEIDEHHRHKDVFEHTMIVIDRAVALETGPDGPVPAPDLTLRLAALMHDIGKPKTRRFEAGGKVSFHHHDAVGAKMTRKRLKALHFDHHVVDDVAELVNLHLRFHGYVDEPWTDSAVRRYVKDAGHLYERLNRLTRADATTQNRRKAMVFASAMDEMEQRVRDLKEKEDFDAIRPDLDGNEIMDLLGLEPGPMVGRAYKHMLEYRLDNGPVDHDTAVEELQVGHLIRRLAALDVLDRRARRQHLVGVLQVLERGAQHHIDQRILTVVHHHDGVGEVVVQRIRLVDGVAPEVVVVVAQGVIPLDRKPTVLQSLGHRLRETGETGAIQHADGNRGVVHRGGGGAVLALGGAGRGDPVVRRLHGGADASQTEDVEVEQHRDHQRHGHDRADHREHNALAMADVLFAGFPLVVVLFHIPKILHE